MAAGAAKPNGLAISDDGEETWCAAATSACLILKDSSCTTEREHTDSGVWQNKLDVVGMCGADNNGVYFCDHVDDSRYMYACVRHRPRGPLERAKPMYPFSMCTCVAVDKSGVCLLAANAELAASNTRVLTAQRILNSRTAKASCSVYGRWHSRKPENCSFATCKTSAFRYGLCFAVLSRSSSA